MRKCLRCEDILATPYKFSKAVSGLRIGLGVRVRIKFRFGYKLGFGI